MPRSGLMLLVYALTLFLSALLLFLVQPLIGKLIVPLLGGFPAVWNTCMVFFQAMLLAGYAYAHYSCNRLGERRQAAVHLGVLLLPVVVLPLGVTTALVPTGGDNPIPGLLLLLFVSAGLPFFAIATTAPLLQRWFASTAHPAARDPYFLYAASNVGSMLALLGYPTLVEPYLTLEHQRWAWSIGYGMLVLLLAVCAVLFWKAPVPAPAKPQKVRPPAKVAPASTAVSPFRRFAVDFAGPSLVAPASPIDEPISLGRGVRWVALAFVPSSLMLGVTSYITTDIAAIPLLWVLPLALYLLSFILVFSRLPGWVHSLMVLCLPVLLLLLIFMMVSQFPAQLWTLILLHLVVLFVAAMVCHGELARSRPAPNQLTTFYLLMSLGGVLGGLFNALLAPLIFTSTAEYPVALALTALLMPRFDRPDNSLTRRRWWWDFLLPIGIGLIALEFFGVALGHQFPISGRLLHLFDRATDEPPGDTASLIVGCVVRAARQLDIHVTNLIRILCYAPPIILAYVLVERPLRFGLGVAAILIASAVPVALDDSVIYRDRGFFGTLLVRSGIDPHDAEAGLHSHRLLHGNILHGKQFTQEDHRGDPLTYYHRTGPMGQFLAAFPGQAAKKDVAVIGLGTGTMAAYAERGHRYVFYEIDPKVKALSFDQDAYFSYVHDARERGADVEIVLGDARLSLDRECATRPEKKYDLIVVDAFSSDAIPVHLLTREAIRIYRSRLKEDGIIAFHTSNKYLRLEPVLANLADDAGWVAVGQSDEDYKGKPGKYTSTWVFLGRRTADFGTLQDKLPREPVAEIVDAEHQNRWWRLEPVPEVGVWTDDYSNLLRVFRWTVTN